MFITSSWESVCLLKLYIKRVAEKGMNRRGHKISCPIKKIVANATMDAPKER